MTNSKRIVITTQSREVFTVRSSAGCGIQGYCGICAAETEMLTVDQVASFALTNTREMIRRIDQGRVHSVETADGRLLVCTGPMQDKCQSPGGENPITNPKLAVKVFDLMTKES